MDITEDEINKARMKKNGGATTERQEPAAAGVAKKLPPYLSGIK